MSNAGGVVERKKTVVGRGRPRSPVLVKGRERVSISSIGGPRIRCPALGLPMAQNGAEWRRWYGADINPLLMKYHKSGDKIYCGRIEKASTN